VADVLAKRAGQPLCRWLADRAAIDLPRGAVVIPVNAVIDASEPAVAAAHALSAVDRGYTVLKVKVGVMGPLRQTSHGWRPVRESAGPAIVLRLDANGAWSDQHVALTALERLSAFDVALCEQPLAATAGYQRFAELRCHSPVPLAVDEGCRSIEDVREVIRWRAADAVVVKPWSPG